MVGLTNYSMGEIGTRLTRVITTCQPSCLSRFIFAQARIYSSFTFYFCQLPELYFSLMKQTVMHVTLKIYDVHPSSFHQHRHNPFASVYDLLHAFPFSYIQ